MKRCQKNWAGPSPPSFRQNKKTAVFFGNPFLSDVSYMLMLVMMLALVYVSIETGSSILISFASRASGLRTLTNVYAAAIELSDNFDRRNWRCVISDAIHHVSGDEISPKRSQSSRYFFIFVQTGPSPLFERQS